jgi:hypothetical protein
MTEGDYDPEDYGSYVLIPHHNCAVCGKMDAASLPDGIVVYVYEPEEDCVVERFVCSGGCRDALLVARSVGKM